MILAVLAALQTATACPVENAVYRPRFEDEDGANIEVDFVEFDYPVAPWSDVQMRVTAAPLDEPIWLTIVTGNGYSIPTANVTARGPRSAEEANNWDPSEIDVLARVQIFAFDASYNAILDTPMADLPAPEHLLLSNLGQLLWYREPRIYMPPVMLDLVDCVED